MSEQVQTSNKKQVILNIFEKDYVEKPEQWVTHIRSKNYIAHIVGLDSQFKLKREFLEKVHVGRKTYFKKQDFVQGEVYEIQCIYYTRSGRESPELSGFFLCKSISESSIILEEISEEEVIQIVKQKYPISEQISSIDKQIAELEKQHQELQLKLQQLQDLQEVVSELHSKVLQEEKKIDQNEVEMLKTQLKQHIKSIAQQLLLVATENKFYKKYESGKVTIKFDKQNDRFEYINVDGTYVISLYDKKPSLPELYRAYKILKEELSQAQKQIEQIKQELSN